MNKAAAVPQLTFRAVLLAIILAMILAAANAYLGLFAGLTIATAIPAAVVSMAVLRLFGGGTILENNIVQTGASAGSSIAAGVIFTLPALIILGFAMVALTWLGARVTRGYMDGTSYLRATPRPETSDWSGRPVRAGDRLADEPDDESGSLP